MEDFLQDFELPETVDVLFLGAGDIRHTIKTIAGLTNRPESASTAKSITFNLVDIDKDVIARDIVLLEIIHQIDVSNMKDVEFLFDVWFNLSLTQSHYGRLNEILKNICARNGTPFSIWKFGNNSSKEKVHATLKIWSDKNVRLDKANVSESRRQLMMCKTPGQYDTRKKEHMEIQANKVALYKDSPYSRPDRSEKETKFYSEIERSIETGDWRKPDEINQTSYVNPTMMRPNSETWYVHHGLKPMYVFFPVETYTLDKVNSLYEACIDILQQVLTSYKDALGKLEVSIKMWVDDVFSFLHHQLQPDASFDLIHTSNLSDHVELLNLLVSCSPRLKNHASVLITETFSWTVKYETLQEYVKDSVGCDSMLFPLVLGIHLAEDFDLGTNNFLSPDIKRRPQAIYWVKNHDDSNFLVSLNDSSDIRGFLETLLLNSVNSNKFTSHITPMTVFSVLFGMQNKVVGGMSELIKFVKQKLDSMIPKKNKIYNKWITWDVLCWLYGLKEAQDEILVVEYKYNYNSDVPKDAVELIFLTFFEVDDLQQSVGIIRNFYFDGFTKTYKFLMLKTSWDCLSDQAAFQLYNIDSTSKNNTFLLKKRDLKIIQTFTKREHIQSHGPTDGQSSLMLSRAEYNDRYEFIKTINSGGEKFQCTSDFCTEEGTGLNISIQYASGVREDFTFIFYCGLDTKKCKIQKSSKQNIIKGIFPKHAHNVGKFMLPFRIIEDSELMPFKSVDKIKDFLFDTKIDQLMFLPMILREKTAFESHSFEDPFVRMMITIANIWHSGAQIPPVITTFSFISNTSNKNKLFDLINRGYFRYRGMPFLKLTFIDTEYAMDLVAKNKLSLPVLTAKRLEAADINMSTLKFNECMVGETTINTEQQALIKKLLTLNSRRMEQSSSDGVTDRRWCLETWLQMHFER